MRSRTPCSWPSWERLLDRPCQPRTGKRCSGKPPRTQRSSTRVKRRMTAGATGKGSFTGNDTGAGAASTAPPSVSATTREEREINPGILRHEFKAAAEEETWDSCSEAPADDGDIGEGAILDQYVRMLEGIRKLPKQLRPAARRDAKKWLRDVLKELRRRKTVERQADHEAQRQKMKRHGSRERNSPRPGPS